MSSATGIDTIDELSVTEILNSILKEFNNFNGEHVKNIEEQILAKMQDIKENYSGFLSDSIKSINSSFENYLNQVKKNSESIIRFCEEYSKIARDYKSSLEKLLSSSNSSSCNENCIHIINHDKFASQIELTKSFKIDIKKMEDSKYKKIHVITSALLKDSENAKPSIKGSFINSQISFLQLTNGRKLDNSPVFEKQIKEESIISFFQDFIHLIFCEITDDKILDYNSVLDKISSQSNLLHYFFEEFQGLKGKVTLKNKQNISLIIKIINNLITSKIKSNSK